MSGTATVCGASVMVMSGTCAGSMAGAATQIGGGVFRRFLLGGGFSFTNASPPDGAETVGFAAGAGLLLLGVGTADVYGGAASTSKDNTAGFGDRANAAARRENLSGLTIAGFGGAGGGNGRGIMSGVNPSFVSSDHESTWGLQPTDWSSESE